METKIAFVHAAYPAGGVERITESIATGLSPHGYKFFIFVKNLKREYLSELDRLHITFVESTLEQGDLAAKINELGIDILVTTTRKLKSLRRQTRCRIVVTHHGLPGWETIDYFENKSHNAAVSGSLAKLLLWHLLKSPMERLTGRFRRTRVERNREGYRHSDRFTVLCEGYKPLMLDLLGPRVATPGDNRIVVMSNYVPPAPLRPQVEKKKRVIFMGRLTWVDKRVDRLLEIWAAVCRDFPDWELCIIGDGPEKGRLIRQSGELSALNVSFLDHTTDPGGLYGEASILCMTSTYEGFPLAVAEGQQAGVIPIAFDVSAGLREQIAPDGVNGFLVAPFDKDEYARKLALLMGDQALRERMRRNVVAKSKEYSDDGRIRNWDRLFRELLK